MSRDFQKTHEEFSINEFRARVLTSINKLNKRETFHVASIELLNLIEQLSDSDDSLAVFMNCLLEVNETQTSSYKREIMKIVAATSKFHTNLLQVYLVKIVSTICKNLKDRDSTVHLACSECLGIISSHVLPTEKDCMELYFKPLFQVLSEQSKQTATAAAMCIASVIRNSPFERIGPYSMRIITRVQKHVHQPSCVARAGLYTVLAALVENTREHCIQYLPTILSILIDALSNNTTSGSGNNNNTNSYDWNERKSAVDGIEKIGKILQNAISPYREEILQVLEKLKFDKYKPVREAVSIAIETLKPSSSLSSLPSSSVSSPSSTVSPLIVSSSSSSLPSISTPNSKLRTRSASATFSGSSLVHSMHSSSKGSVSSSPLHTFPSSSSSPVSNAVSSPNLVCLSSSSLHSSPTQNSYRSKARTISYGKRSPKQTILSLACGKQASKVVEKEKEQITVAEMKETNSSLSHSKNSKGEQSHPLTSLESVPCERIIQPLAVCLNPEKTSSSSNNHFFVALEEDQNKESSVFDQSLSKMNISNEPLEQLTENIQSQNESISVLQLEKSFTNQYLAVAKQCKEMLSMIEKLSYETKNQFRVIDKRLRSLENGLSQLQRSAVNDSINSVAATDTEWPEKQMELESKDNGENQLSYPANNTLEFG